MPYPKKMTPKEMKAMKDKAKNSGVKRTYKAKPMKKGK